MHDIDSFLVLNIQYCQGYDIANSIDYHVCYFFMIWWSVLLANKENPL